jgi:hypothetical protein
VITDLSAHPGSLVAAGEVVAHILGPGTRHIDVSMSAGDRPGAAFEVNGTPANLVTSGASVAADGARHDLLETDLRALVPGQVVAVHLSDGSPTGVLVPLTALVPVPPSGELVFVEVAPNRFVARPVTIAAESSDLARVAGLDANDRVVTRGAMSLRGETLRADLGTAD